MGFKEIGKKIQQGREEKGYSQEQLARMIGCSQSALSNYEKGKRRLYLSQLEQLAQVLDQPIEYFMETRTTEEHKPGIEDQDKDLLRLLNEFYGLNQSERQSVLDFIQFIRWRRNKEVSAIDKPGTNPRAEEVGGDSPRSGKRRDKSAGPGTRSKR
ncbi:MAG: helix-turn-helix domain-containing protein [Chitinophagales bacterium]